MEVGERGLAGPHALRRVTQVPCTETEAVTTQAHSMEGQAVVTLLPNLRPVTQTAVRGVRTDKTVSYILFDCYISIYFQ